MKIALYEIMHLRLRAKCQLHHTRGHNKKIYVSQARLNVRKSSFYLRTAEAWNKLLDEVVNAPSKLAFESRLDRVWARNPLKAEIRATPATVY